MFIFSVLVVRRVLVLMGVIDDESTLVFNRYLTVYVLIFASLLDIVLLRYLFAS